MKKTILTALAATTCMMTMNGQPKLSATNIDEVLQAMTLEEKARLLVGGANNFFGDQAVVGGEATLVAGAAGTSPEIARLGILATVLTEGGNYTFNIGASSRDIRCTATTKVGQYTEKVSNALAPKVKLNLLKQ